jgi:hypothetical protein
MKYEITKQQTEQLIKLYYDLRCPAPEWEAVKKLLAELPEIKEDKKK